ncbi:MAG: hypothetical protein HQ483_10385 [Rhodospirillales bacterium]|nr:hypothetical protein [Rhodospirillales bacterium]
MRLGKRSQGNRDNWDFNNLSDEQQPRLNLLDQELHKLWGLGRNLLLVWTPGENFIDVLVIPHYTISEHAQRAGEEADLYANSALGLRPTSFLEDVIANPKHVTRNGMAHLARLMDCQTSRIPLPFQPGPDLPYPVIETAIKRYSISYIDDRAVALFDIVGFSLLSPLEQVTQLNSLSYSVNSSYSKMLDNNIEINFARTTTGDGFYIWNRDRSGQANINLYHFMHLVLADNAIARSKAKGQTTPLLRACFHIGGHYEFYQSEGLSPTVYSFIVGDVTIELARMIDRALPGQVLVGDFLAQMPNRITGVITPTSTTDFIERTQDTLSSLKGLVLSGDHIEQIQCYLTGARRDGEFAIQKFLIADKHGRTRNVFNAKINIYRSGSEPIFLGLQASELDDFKIESSGFS